ncbi:MAG: glycosyl transferase family 36 [Planctomycetota bacterium]|nr:glycosyl transferase family 36 [Planctomycetota bacterium]
MPWTNVVCNGRYGFVVSQNGGGFSWFDDAQHNVLTRWEMDLVRDDRGRFLYLADLDSLDLWSLAPAPCWPAYEEYRCEHTLGSTTFHTRYSGIAATWTLAVAPDQPAEVWRVKLRNTTNKPRRLRLATYLEWCCGVAPDSKREFHRLFITTAHDEKRRAVIANKNMWDLPSKSERDHWNMPWPYTAAHAVIAGQFDAPLAIADKALFLGRYGQTPRPAAMFDAPRSGEGFGRFADGAASVGGDLRLAPGEEREFAFTIAIESSRDRLNSLLDALSAPGAAERAVSGAHNLWDTILKPAAVETEAQDFDVLNAYWLPYQAISGRLWGRTGYYQQSGAFGFRDQLQDSQVWLPLDPSRCRAQILLHAHQQFADGSVNHWWHALARFGNHTACSDDYLWLPFITASYIRETGDFSILDDRAPFVDDTAPATILDHCLRSFRRSFARTSPRGIPLIGSCDWNDGLSAAGIAEKGESVWLSFFLALTLQDWARILDQRGEARLADEFRSRRLRLIDAANQHAWDGAWFRRATTDAGVWIGAADSPAGKIYLNAQTWAILADAADQPRLTRAWQSVHEHLLRDMGPLLLAPAYTEPDTDIGYITRYSPGSRENGGVYMHAATWALMAACKLKDQRAVERIWDAISPPKRGAVADAYRAEPYVTPGNVDGPLSDTPGRAGWTWYTGSAAWLNRVSVEWVLGLRATWEGLAIDPCPMRSMGRVDATRTWRGRRVRVRFDARAFDPARPAIVTFQGRPLQGGILRPADLESSTGDIELDVSWEQQGQAPGRQSVMAAAAKENAR